MIQLVKKELHQLIPFALLWLCLAVLYYGAELATVRMDEQSYLAWCNEYCDVGSNVDLALFIIIFYLIAAYSLFPREFDESTIDFLRSLPIGRSTVFISKVVAVWLLLVVLLLLDRAIQTLLLTANAQTLTGRSYPQIDFTFLLRDILFALVIASHGVFLSWFRTTGLILYAAYLVALIWLEQVQGTSGVYNIFRFFNNEYHGQSLRLDWSVIQFHLFVALLLLIVSFFLWTRTDSKPRNPGGSKWSKVLPVLFSVLGFIVVAGWMIGLLQTASTQALESDIRHNNTAYYKFSYRQSDVDAIEALQDTADLDYEILSDKIGASSQPFIHADMTSDSQHALGLASWKKIRMVVDGRRDSGPLPRRVLSHETAHVFQSVESNRALSKFGNSTGFFIEGMAQFLSFAIVPDPARESNWLISSVAWQRQNIKFDEMANRQLFDSKYNPELLYGIGDIWSAAMVDVCSEQSLGDFLRSIGRDDAPPNLSGTRLWRHHLQHIGCELESVNNRWRQYMQDVLVDRSAGAFPHFKNVVVESSSGGDLITVRAELEPGESEQLPDSYYLRVQSETQLAKTISPVLSGKLIRDGVNVSVEFSVLRRLIDGSRFRYQMGYIPLPDSRHYFDRWRSGTVPESD